MSKGSSIEACLVEFAGFPQVVQLSQRFVHFEVVEGDKGDDLFFESRTVGGWGDSVFIS
jgi:hypothetical protein